MELIVRQIDRSECRTTENLTREVFWNLYNPGCSEHLMLYNLRKSNAYVKALDFVALYNNEIVGHVISTKAVVVDNKNIEHEVLHVGPISVNPVLQGKGIGTKLIWHSIKRAKELKYVGIILFGNPSYYKRFGFTNAKEYKITTKDGLNFEPFMSLELQDYGLVNMQGRFFMHESAEINEKQLSSFEKQFPAKEKGEPKIKINTNI